VLLTDYKWFQARPRGAGDSQPILIVRRLGLQDYQPLFESMRYLARHSSPERQDEIWLLSHKPVFTQGQAGRPEHVLNPGSIPVVQVDRGGQVTYHGPGQLVVYLLINVRRRKLGVRELVDLIEQSILATLTHYGISGSTRPKAPGVYVKDAKIAALGLRIRNGWSYHGLSLNVNMDLSPFSKINPCGYPQLSVTQIAEFVDPESLQLQDVGKVLTDELLSNLGYLTHYSEPQQQPIGV
jgi:lipoyl(octanoyl) transferase